MSGETAASSGAFEETWACVPAVVHSCQKRVRTAAAHMAHLSFDHRLAEAPPSSNTCVHDRRIMPWKELFISILLRIAL